MNIKKNNIPSFEEWLAKMKKNYPNKKIKKEYEYRKKWMEVGYKEAYKIDTYHLLEKRIEYLESKLQKGVGGVK